MSLLSLDSDSLTLVIRKLLTRCVVSLSLVNKYLQRMLNTQEILTVLFETVIVVSPLLSTLRNYHAIPDKRLPLFVDDSAAESTRLSTNASGVLSLIENACIKIRNLNIDSFRFHFTTRYRNTIQNHSFRIVYKDLNLSKRRIISHNNDVMALCSDPNITYGERIYSSVTHIAKELAKKAKLKGRSNLKVTKVTANTLFSYYKSNC